VIHIIPDSKSWADGKRLDLDDLPAAKNQIVTETLNRFRWAQPIVEVWLTVSGTDIRVSKFAPGMPTSGYYVTSSFQR